MDGILAEHIGFDLLNLFENGFFILIVVFIEFIAVGFDSVFDEIENFIGHIGFSDAYGDFFIVSFGDLSNDGIETLKILD